MNPLLWRRDHQYALLVIALSGAVAGVLLGFIHSPSFDILGRWQLFAAWVSHPASYWQWPLYGFLISAGVFYGVQLLRPSN